MKRYIKPITEIHNIELQQMIAQSPGGILQDKDTGSSGFEGLSKDIDYATETSSPWSGDEEE